MNPPNPLPERGQVLPHKGGPLMWAIKWLPLTQSVQSCSAKVCGAGVR